MSDPTGQQPAPPTDAAPPAAQTFSQEDVNRISGKARAEGRQTVLNDLGVDSLDALKAVIAEGKKATDAQKTELQRLMEEIDSYKLTVGKLESTIVELNKRIAALRAGLVEKLWPSVAGDTLDEMTEAAKALVAELAPPPPPPVDEPPPPAKPPIPDTNATGGRAKVQRGPNQFSQDEIEALKRRLAIR